MERLSGSVRRIYRDQGAIQLVKRTIQFGYDKFIRPLIPRRTVSYNSIPVRASHLGDSVIPWQETDIQGYESSLIKGIRSSVQEDDTVVVVGGGWGVSTVAATNQISERGQVITYEGGKESIEKVVDTVQLNGVEDRVSVHHAIVGGALSLRGDGTDAKVVSPVELPNCDVLVLDCEGAELDILGQMNIHPRNLIVETHGMFGATEEKVRDRISRAGYNLSSSEVAEERLRAFCEENGIYVICADSVNPTPRD